MESLEYVFDTNDLSNIYELSTETPVGWSSICLDQTINYYIEYNSAHVEDDKTERNE
uniref:hypothetical protein n=1 Tax=Pachymeniopsis lanceolata TaxID=151733 RepID=UPI002A83CC4A|nr:hypothetical protein UYL67_pgp006 [Pachymeniopsis lanceolata]WOL37332.1 hypothetical protein [Pachymeniopsis lanceolata]